MFSPDKISIRNANDMPVIIWFFCHFYYEIPYVARSNTLGTLSWNSGGEKSEFRAIYKGYCFNLDYERAN